jgi:hypothetical protein
MEKNAKHFQIPTCIASRAEGFHKKSEKGSAAKRTMRAKLSPGLIEIAWLPATFRLPMPVAFAPKGQ